MRTALIAAVILTATSLSAADAKIDGKWHGHIDTPTGPVPVGFVFKTEGASLAGSTTGIDGIDLPLKNGKLKEQVVSFTVDIDIGGLSAELVYRGVVSVDKIDFRATFMGEPLDFTVRRVKQ